MEIQNEKLIGNPMENSCCLLRNYCIVLDTSREIREIWIGVGWWDLTKGKIEEEVNGARK